MTRTNPRLQRNAAQLREMHRPGRPLVLPNVWDAASARAVQEAGFSAVATGSAAVADSLGFADHEGAPASEMLAAAARIAGAVTVPVTADAEAGYGLEAAELVELLLDAGVSGCNLEDTDHRSGALVDPAAQAEFLAAVRSAARTAAVDLVINARVDVFLHPAQDRGARIDDAVRRSRRYLVAGADCVYPILAIDEQDIIELLSGIDGPVNLLCNPKGPTVRRLAELGAARVSFGASLYRAVHSSFSSMLTRISEGHDRPVES